MVFKGFPDTLGAEERLQELEKLFATYYSHLDKPTFENVYSGPRGERKLSRVALADFGTEDKARSFTKATKEVKAGALTLTVAPPRTELNTKRNVALRKAEELVKASPHAQNKTVKLKWEARSVTVNEDTVFTQNRTETGGTFKGAFANLSLPE